MCDVESAALVGEAVRLDELRLLALERRIDADLSLGRHQELIPELETVVADQPLREPFRRLLMLALYRSGRQADALAGSRRTREMLADRLGIDPSASLQDLELAILQQPPNLDLPALVATSVPSERLPFGDRHLRVHRARGIHRTDSGARLRELYRRAATTISGPDS